LINRSLKKLKTIQIEVIIKIIGTTMVIEAMQIRITIIITIIAKINKTTPIKITNNINLEMGIKIKMIKKNLEN
jgi:hypothetical protein